MVAEAFRAENGDGEFGSLLEESCFEGWVLVAHASAPVSGGAVKGAFGAEDAPDRGRINGLMDCWIHAD